MPSPQPIQVAIAGAGAFGRNHLRVYRELEHLGYPVRLVAVIDSNPEVAATAATLYNIPAFASVENCLAANMQIDAASVCVPTQHHGTVAKSLLAAGVDLLIEKPFASTTSEADQIIALAAHHRRIVQIGHLERFNPAVASARAHLNRPMFFEAHRLSIFTPRSLDVDVVLDLMIHDLDIVLNFVSSPVREVRAVGLPVLSNKVDIANVRIEFENGCIANFTASRVSTERVRKLRFFQPHQYVSLDFARQDLLMIDAPTAGNGATLNAAQLAALVAAATHDGTHPSAGLSLRKIAIEQGEPLRLEIESFLESVRNRTQPVVSANDGRAALALALDINREIAGHAHRAGLASESLR